MTESSNPDHRWSKLVALVHQQFEQHHQDPKAMFQADRTRLKLSAMIPRTYPPERFSVKLDEETVLTGDLPAIAVHFYEEYRKAVVRRGA
jgi:hypothetical protein